MWRGCRGGKERGGSLGGGGSGGAGSENQSHAYLQIAQNVRSQSSTSDR